MSAINTEKNTQTFHSRLIKLTNTKFTKEQSNTLKEQKAVL